MRIVSIAARLLTAVLAIGMLSQNAVTVYADETPDDGKAYVVSTEQSYDTLREAIDAAAAEDTIYLGKGVYYSCDENTTTSQVNESIAKDKNLTIVGAGEETIWNIEWNDGGNNNGDYSLTGATGLTVKDMTLNVGVAWSDIQSESPAIKGNKDSYPGIVHLTDDSKVTFENCVVNGCLTHIGKAETTFKNVTFNPVSTEYAVKIYNSKETTFTGCTFNAQDGRMILAYVESWNARTDGQPYEITVDSCVFNSDRANKCAVSIKDASAAYQVAFTGDNEVKGIDANDFTCSRLYEVEKLGSQGQATVTIGDTTVWADGELQGHEDYISGGSYKNQVANNDNYAYGEGYKDNAYHYSFSAGEGKFYRVCDYCGYRVEVDMEVLGADMLIDDNTEHDAVVEVTKGQEFDMTGELHVSGIKEQMAAIDDAFPYQSYTVENIEYEFKAVMTVPDGITIPDKPVLTTSGLNNVFEIDGGTVSGDGKSITVVFSLTENALSSINTFAQLKEAVHSVDDVLGVTVEDVKVTNGAPVNENLTMEGTVTGSFKGTAYQAIHESAIGVTPNFSKEGFTGLDFTFDWTAKQTEDGRDAILEDGDDIQLTVIVQEDEKEPEEEDKRHEGGYGDITLYKVDAQTSQALAGARIALYKSNGDYVSTYTTDSNGAIEIKNAAYSTYYFQEMEAPEGYLLDNTHQNFVLDKDHPNVTLKFTNTRIVVPVVETPVEEAPAETPVDTTEAAIATGDNSLMALYGVLFLMAGAGLVMWTRKAHAR